MKRPAAVCLLAFVVPVLVAQSVIEVGAGSPTAYIRSLFVSAYNRGIFSRLAALPPVGVVRRFGNTGLVQEFNDSTRPNSRLALVKATTLSDADNVAGDVYQVLTDVYAYYTTVGVNTAGYPVSDSQLCPNASCQYGIFDRGYALFAYSQGANDPEGITVKEAFFTRWQISGGINGLGPATSAETNVTSSFTGDAVVQSFVNGALYSIASGNLAGRMVAVRTPVFTLYAAQGGHTGTLGFPIGDEITLADGRKRQTFEGGAIEYDNATGPAIRMPVQSVLLRPSTTPVRLNLGETVTLDAVIYASDGTQLTDRQVNFSTTNGRVVSVQALGTRATVRAIGGGTANVTAASEGKASVPITFVVNAQCCGIGEGAPTAAIQQAFSDAATRNRLQLRLPGPERVRRAGSGYVQEFQSSDGTARYLLALAEGTGQAYVVTGALLARYEELGGAISFLGYPAEDAGSGRQLFTGGALAGMPVRAVTGAILKRWSASGFDGGAMGAPIADAVSVSSFTGNDGQMQSFANGLALAGPRGVFFVVKTLAAKYLELGGPPGALGFPTADEITSGGKRRQDFEGGHLEYSPGSAEISAMFRERRPSVSAVPATVLPGGRVRVTVSGFPDRTSLRVSAADGPDFLASAAVGAFTWDVVISPDASPGLRRIRAADTANEGLAAEGGYSVKALAEARLQVTKVAGDGQTAAPGSELAGGLRVRIQDEGGNPVGGLTVRFAASPGAEVRPASVETDAAGIAEARLRLPAAESLALVTAEVGRQVVTFSARAAASNLVDFPQLAQQGSGTAAEGDALLVATAAILRHYQNRSELPTPNGSSEPAALKQFLERSCVVPVAGGSYCDGFVSASRDGARFVNLWRLAEFVGGGLDVSVERAELAAIRTLAASGTPVLVALAMKSGDASSGAHFVVATGMAPDGGVIVQDSNPVFSRSRLSEYVNGFDVSGRKWSAEITGAVRLLPRAPASTGFLVIVGGSRVSLAARTGGCDRALGWPDAHATGSPLTRTPEMLWQYPCEGTAEDYQLDIQSVAEFRATVTDLAQGGGRSELAGSGSAAFRLSREGSWLSIAPQTTTLAVGGVVNAASPTAGLAPGALVSIFGAGLLKTGSETNVEVGGRRASVVAAFPFQINAQIPFDTPPGSHVVRVQTPYGAAQTTAAVQPMAPAIFRSGGRPAIVNANGKLNGPTAPAQRGTSIVIYTTGLGNVARSGEISPVTIPLTVVLRDGELRPSFAGLSPGLIGVYQVNLSLPATVAPGAGVPLALRQGGVQSDSVEIHIQ